MGASCDEAANGAMKLIADRSRMGPCDGWIAGARLIANPSSRDLGLEPGGLINVAESSPR